MYVPETITATGRRVIAPMGQFVPEPAAMGAWDTIVHSLDTLWQDFLLRLPLIIAGLFVLLLTWGVAWIAAAVVTQTLRRSALRPGLRHLFYHLTGLVVWLVGITISAIIIFPGMTPARVFTVLGLSSFAIGFAFKDILQNFMAGILILWRFPFDPGDFVECAGFKGRVEETTIRMTRIREIDGQLVVLPNVKIFTEALRVITSLDEREVIVTLGVDDDQDLELCRAVIRRAVDSCLSVSTTRPTQVLLLAFGTPGFQIEARWWTKPTPPEVNRSRDEVIRAIVREPRAAGVHSQVPYRMLLSKEPLNIKNL